jgi:diguanylate cyclase (GGDEF)-like protein/PAS domain S-box-containing protein
VNDAAVDKYGYSRDEFLGLTITDIRPDADRERLIEAVEMSGESVRHGGVWQHFTKSGETIDVEITSHRLQFAGRPGCLVMAQDVTDRLRAEQELAYQVMHDALTGLPNRTLLLDRLGQALGKLGRSDRRVGVLFVDLDRFKIVNDAAGHNVGDRLLIEVGARMQNAVRPGDTVARIGGDEFVVLLADVADRTDAAAVSGRIGWALDAPFVIGGSEFFVSASQGIALADAGDTPEEVLGRADAAMYTAKDRGGARSEFANAAVRVRARNRLSIESALRRAVDQGEFVLHYQPVVELITGRIVGAEALVRWRPDGERLRSPDEFLAVAEDSGLIVPIGEWVIDRALSDAGAWAAEEPLGIAVNLSARQLSAPNLPFALARAISTSGVEPHRIHLEIAESVLMRDLERSVDRVSELREAGLQIHVDNVGAGYSSLASVRQLPVDAIKIDRSLVERLDDDHVDASMVTAVLDLSRSIGVGVVAVGVETAAQHALLRTIGCELAQGFWLARPMPVAEFVALLHAGPLPLAVEMRETEVS